MHVVLLSVLTTAGSLSAAKRVAAQHHANQRRCQVPHDGEFLGKRYASFDNIVWMYGKFTFPLTCACRLSRKGSHIKVQLRQCVSAYHGFLGKSLVLGQSKNFWNYHKRQID